MKKIDIIIVIGSLAAILTVILTSIIFVSDLDNILYGITREPTIHTEECSNLTLLNNYNDFFKNKCKRMLKPSTEYLQHEAISKYISLPHGTFVNATIIKNEIGLCEVFLACTFVLDGVDKLSITETASITHIRNTTNGTVVISSD